MYLVLQYDNRVLGKSEQLFCKMNKIYCKKHKYKYKFINKKYNIPPYWIKVFLTYKYLKKNIYKGYYG